MLPSVFSSVFNLQFPHSNNNTLQITKGPLMILRPFCQIIVANPKGRRNGSLYRNYGLFDGYFDLTAENWPLYLSRPIM